MYDGVTWISTSCPCFPGCDDLPVYKSRHLWKCSALFKVNDCYFCMMDISRFMKTKNRHNITYPDIAPVPHSEQMFRDHQVLVPPLHVKRELVVTLDKRSEDFKYTSNMFSNSLKANIKSDIFTRDASVTRI